MMPEACRLEDGRATPKALPGRWFERVFHDRGSGEGFTLLELSIVMAVIMILVSIILPAYRVSIKRAREAVLKDDLYTMRSVIDEFTVDKQRPPESLQELVDSGYLHRIPMDPMTGSAETWQVDIEDVPVPPDQTASGVVDVHSGSEEKALDDTTYNTW
jgi:general secretion pathway protein G